MKIYGHRGAPVAAAENTLASFVEAMRAGAHGIECDVRRTADGALVVIHDDDVSRTTGGTGVVSQMTLAQVRSLDPADGSGASGVPTVEEVFEAVGGRAIFEVKGTSWGPVDARPAAADLARYLAGRDAREAVISCFDPAVLEVVRTEAPSLRTGLLGAPAFDAASVIEAAAAAGHEICFLHDDVCNPESIGRARSAGLRVIPWTVNRPERIVEMAGWGADGLITDDPAGALSALRATR